MSARMMHSLTALLTSGQSFQKFTQVVEVPVEEEVYVNPMVTYVTVGAVALVISLVLLITILNKHKEKQTIKKKKEAVIRANKKLKEKKKKENEALDSLFDEYEDEYTDSDTPAEARGKYTIEALEAAKKVRRPAPVVKENNGYEVLIDSGDKKSDETSAVRKRSGINIQGKRVTEETPADNVNAYKDDLNALNGVVNVVEEVKEVAPVKEEPLPVWAMGTGANNGTLNGDFSVQQNVTVKVENPLPAWMVSPNPATAQVAYGGFF